MTKTMRRDYGPFQLAERLGLTQWQLDRALSDRLIRQPDRPGGRWSAALVDAAANRAEEILAAVGTLPDVGAHRAAEHLAERFELPVTADTVVELAARGQLLRAGSYRGYTQYCGRCLEAFADRAAVEAAIADGQLLTSDEAADRLQIRRSDFDHLPRAGLLTAAKMVPGPYQRARGGRPAAKRRVALYRVGDLAALAEDPSIDWEAVRAVQPGQRSPLADLPTAAAQS